MASIWKGPLLNSRDPAGPRYEGAPWGWVTALILVGAVVFTTFVFTGHQRERHLLDALESTGRTTAGQITKLTHTRRRYTHTHVVHYDYTVAGHRYESREYVSAGWFNKLHVGNPVTVTYLPSDPARGIARPIAQARRDASRDRLESNILCAIIWVGTLWAVYLRARNSDFAFGSVRAWYDD
jgi:hypothetical protein